MSPHDTWVFLHTPSLYDSIKSLFPHGFPMRDPFSLNPVVVDASGKHVVLWTVDMERLDDSQVDALARVIAERYFGEATVQDVIDDAIANGGFGISDEWIERMELGAEGYQRTMELKEFLETAPQPPNAHAWNNFVRSQFERWIDGDAVPLAMPTNIDEVPEELRTPELVQAIHRNRINQILEHGGYSVMDILSGRAIADVMNALETDPDVSWDKSGDPED